MSIPGTDKEPATLEPRVTETRILSRDGYSLAATLFEVAEPRATVVINSAMATPRQFYRHFAQALATTGFDVVTWDYRGIGGSRPESLRGFATNIRDWTMLDTDGVLDWAIARDPKRSLLLVGHSLGGQVAGLLENAASARGLVTLSSQSGHWRLQGGEQKAAVLLHTYVTMPLLSHAFGYLPWSKFGSTEDLPKGAALEWARWCRNPDYLLGDDTLPLERFQQFQAPVLAYSVDDDKWGQPHSVDAMMRAYPNVERRHLLPADLGMKKIGHFGFFRRTASHLWPEVIDWLSTRA